MSQQCNPPKQYLCMFLTHKIFIPCHRERVYTARQNKKSMGSSSPGDPDTWCCKVQPSWRPYNTRCLVHLEVTIPYIFLFYKNVLYENVLNFKGNSAKCCLRGLH